MGSVMRITMRTVMTGGMTEGMTRGMAYHASDRETIACYNVLSGISL